MRDYDERFVLENPLSHFLYACDLFPDSPFNAGKVTAQPGIVKATPRGQLQEEPAADAHELPHFASQTQQLRRSYGPVKLYPSCLSVHALLRRSRFL